MIGPTCDGPVLQPPGPDADRLGRPGHPGHLHPVGEVQQPAVAVERVPVQLVWSDRQVMGVSGGGGRGGQPFSLNLGAFIISAKKIKSRWEIGVFPYKFSCTGCMSLYFSDLQKDARCKSSLLLTPFPQGTWCAKVVDSPFTTPHPSGVRTTYPANDAGSGELYPCIGATNAPQPNFSPSITVFPHFCMLRPFFGAGEKSTRARTMGRG